MKRKKKRNESNFKVDRIQRRYLLAVSDIRQGGQPGMTFAACFDCAPSAVRQRWRKAALKLLSFGNYVQWLRDHHYPDDYIDNWHRRECAKKQGVQRNSRAKKRPLISYAGFDALERQIRN